MYKILLGGAVATARRVRAIAGDVKHGAPPLVLIMMFLILFRFDHKIATIILYSLSFTSLTFSTNSLYIRQSKSRDCVSGSCLCISRLTGKLSARTPLSTLAL